MDQPEWMAHAWKELGVTEVPGRRDNPRIMRFYADVGHGSVRHDETPWCAAFLGGCLERAGLKSTRSLRARSYLKWGRDLPAPRSGAIAVLSRGPNPALGHVGFIVGASDDKLYLLGGNQTDQVRVSSYARSRLLAVRWPDEGASTPMEGAGEVDETAAAGALDERDDVFERALEHVLEMEGGYTDDQYDPGGATNFGITIGDFAREKGVEITAETIGVLKAQLRRIPSRMVRDIYRRRYWLLAQCPKLAPPLALMHFDAAVNQGVGRAARMLQEAAGAEVNGEVGPQTLAAARAAPVRRSLERYGDIRRRHYRGLKHFWRFGRGWLRRVDKTLAAAERLIGRSAADERPADGQLQTQHSPQSEKETTAMASKPRTKTQIKAPTKWWGESVTIWGAIITTLSTVLPTLGPLIGLDITAELVQQLGENLVRLIKAAGGVIGILMTVYGRFQATTLLKRREVKLSI